MEEAKKPQWLIWSDQAIEALASAGIVWREGIQKDDTLGYSIPWRGSRRMIAGALCQPQGTKGGSGIYADDVSVCFIYAPESAKSYLGILAASISCVAKAKTEGWDPFGLRARAKAKRLAVEFGKVGESEGERSQRR